VCARNQPVSCLSTVHWTKYFAPRLLVKDRVARGTCQELHRQMVERKIQLPTCLLSVSFPVPTKTSRSSQTSVCQAALCKCSPLDGQQH
jgi:hypothetical protein